MRLLFLVRIYGRALSCECACLSGSEGVGKCVFTVNMLTSTQCLCVCVFRDEGGGFVSFSWCISVSLRLFLMFIRH